MGKVTIKKKSYGDVESIIKRLANYINGSIPFGLMVDGIAVDLGIKNDPGAYRNLENHLYDVVDALEEFGTTPSDFRSFAKELLRMNF